MVFSHINVPIQVVMYLSSFHLDLKCMRKDTLDRACSYACTVIRSIEVKPFVQESGPNLPDDFDPARWCPIDYFNLLFEPQMFAEIANYTNSYATFKCNEHQRQQMSLNTLTLNGMKQHLMKYKPCLESP